MHFISRLRDGGVFIFFASPADAQRAKLELRAKGFDGRTVECFSVQGTPFIEDMLLSAPSSRVAVTLPAEGVAVRIRRPRCYICDMLSRCVARAFAIL